MGLIFLDDESGDLNTLGFDILRIGAVIANQGLGHDHHLAPVRRICEDLLIAGHAGVKYQLSGGFSRSGKG